MRQTKKNDWLHLLNFMNLQMKVILCWQIKKLLFMCAIILIFFFFKNLQMNTILFHVKCFWVLACIISQLARQFELFFLEVSMLLNTLATKPPWKRAWKSWQEQSHFHENNCLARREEREEFTNLKRSLRSEDKS